MLRNTLNAKECEKLRSKGCKRFRLNEERSGIVLGAVRNDDEEAALEELVFGGQGNILEKLRVDVIQSEPQQEVRKAAWVDEDDETITPTDRTVCKKLKSRDKYAEHLRENFKNTVGVPKWSKITTRNDNSSDSEDDLLTTSGNVLRKSQPLGSNFIELHKCYDLNYEDKSSRLVNMVEFHPTSQVALVAEECGKTIIFQVDGKNNSKIQSIQFENFPLSVAHFTRDGTQIVVGSRQHNHFYYYDMLSGKIVKVPWEKGLDSCNKRRMYCSPCGRFLVAAGRFGHIHLISAKTKEWIGQLKMNGEATCIAFSEDGHYMYSHGDGGQVYIWDLNNRCCVNQFYDEGCIQGTSIAASPNGQYLATGSDSGVVNVYTSPGSISVRNPKPIKTFLNLTTEINHLKFNHSTEILAMSSQLKDNAIKLAHFPSMTVFANFPLKNMKCITSVDISINGGYMAIANNKGRAHLFRIKKYQNY